MFSETLNMAVPPACLAIAQMARDRNFNMCCEALTGNLLRSLVAGMQPARILEIGTGLGYSTGWLLDGMGREAHLCSVEKEAAFSRVASETLGADQRLELMVMDAAKFIQDSQHRRYDFIFADAWPGKFIMLEELLGMLALGGTIVFDDLNPQANWPPNHQASVDGLVAKLDARNDLVKLKLDWASGIFIGVKTA